MWFVAAAAGAAFLDIGQVSLATGGAPLGRLAAMVLSLYIAIGFTTGTLVRLGATLIGARSPAAAASQLAIAVVGFTSAVVLPYINIVHLPGIREPVTIAVNLAAIAIAALAAFGLSRSATVARLAAHRAVALAVLLVFVTATSFLARGSGDADAPAPPVAGPGGPDVFVVVIDTLRHDRTGPRSPTKRLSLLAARGTRFDRAYAQASWTKPSVASLFTSLYPSTHGANLRRDRLAGDIPTLPEVLADRGYRTAVFSANPWISPAFGFDRGVQFFHESEHETFARLVMLLRGIKTFDKLLPWQRPLTAGLRRLEEIYGLRGARSTNCARDVAIVDSFRTWMGEAADHPVFAYFHLMSPHIPYDPPGREHDFAPRDQVALLHQTEALPEKRRELLLDLYDDTIGHVDRLLGRLIEVIEDSGRGENAIIVVTADHGEEFHEHGRWGHGKSLYDEVVRVPLVLVGPGVGAARTNRSPAMLVDVLPTVAAIVGAEANPTWEGRDLRDLPGDGAAYAELIREGGFESFMLYRDGSKYLESSGGVGEEKRAELYDVRADPAESKNLTESAPRAAVAGWAAELGEMRERAAAKAGTRAPSGQVEIDEDARRKLEALGYFN